MSIRLTILFLFLSLNLSSQSTQDLIIHVQTLSTENLPLAHITVDNNAHYISDNEGIATIPTNKSEVNLRISHLGYVTIDTTILLDKSMNQEFTLAPNNYSIDPITISDSQRLLEKSNWWIKDICLHEYGFLVSARENSKQYLYLYDKKGNQVQKVRNKIEHSNITKGLKTGHYHLMSEIKGQEVIVSTDTVIFLNQASIEQYEKTINHFKFSNKNYSVAEEWSLHNKRMTMSVIDNKSYERKPFYESYDEEGFIRSQSVYREILGLYYQQSERDDPRDINAGMKPDNIIKTGEWSGDLYDLIISDTIQEVYNYYISLHYNKIKTSIQIKDQKLYILDNQKKKLSIYDLEKEMINLSSRKVNLPDNIVSGEFIASNQQNELIIESNGSYFSFDTSMFLFEPISFAKRDYYFPKTNFITDNTMYTLAQRSRIKHKLSIQTSKINGRQ